jgi:subtilisin family serine protease
VLSSALAVDPNDAGWPQQWGLRIAGFPQAWDLVPSPQRVVVVAVVDTGVDPAQADLQGVLVPGYDFLNQSATPSDDEGHGTSVAGIIAARTGNRVGIAGVCGTCQIMPVKVLDAHGVGDDSVIAAGIVWAADHGAGVINLSLGGPGSTPALSDAIAYAVAKGALVIAAAGNEATTIPFYPAADPNAVSVAGTTAADRPYPWSDFGTWVKLAAPGCNIAPTVGGGYATFCGTSAATPVVSGLAAMARSASPAAGPQEIERALESSATPIAGFVQYGRINAAGTLSVLTPARTAAPTRVTFRGVLSARAPTRSYTRVVDAGTLTATLAFKGAPSVSLALVHDSPSGPGAVATGASPLRLVRLVQAGTVRIVVRAVRPRRARFVLTLHQSNGGP